MTTNTAIMGWVNKINQSINSKHSVLFMYTSHAAINQPGDDNMEVGIAVDHKDGDFI